MRNVGLASATRDRKQWPKRRKKKQRVMGRCSAAHNRLTSEGAQPGMGTAASVQLQTSTVLCVLLLYSHSAAGGGIFRAVFI